MHARYTLGFTNSNETRTMADKARKSVATLLVTLMLFAGLVPALPLFADTGIKTGNALTQDNSSDEDSATQDVIDQNSDTVEDNELQPPEEITEGINPQDDEPEESTEAVTDPVPSRSPASPNSISGFIWIDGGSMEIIGEEGETETLSTAWDGLYNGDEQPLEGCPVYLFAAGDLTATLFTTETDGNGEYTFTDLQAGEYIVGVGSFSSGYIEYLLALAETTENKFTIDWEAYPPMAYTEALEIEDGQSVMGISTGLYPFVHTTPRTAESRASYTVDISNSTSLSTSGRGYSYSSSRLTFNSGAASDGNTYIITRTLGLAALPTWVDFANNFNPASVTFQGPGTGVNDRLILTNGLSFLGNFNSDITFNYVNFRYVTNIGTTEVPQYYTLTFPVGFNAKIGINDLMIGYSGVSTPSLSFVNYNRPLVFNGLEVYGNLYYSSSYNEDITVSSNFRVDGTQQLPANYSGEITIGAPGTSFTEAQYICRESNKGSAGAYRFILPNGVQSMTFDSAKTSGTNGRLLTRLISTDVFELFLKGESVITGYISIPSSGNTPSSLTIDSADDPGSETGVLKITTSDTNACLGSGLNESSGRVSINGGTIEATQTYSSGSNSPAAIGSGAGGSANVVIRGGKVTAIANLGKSLVQSGSQWNYNTDGSSRSGAAIGNGCASTSQRGSASVTITGGTVIAKGGAYGAGIGGGAGATSVTVMITGGNVTATTGAVLSSSPTSRAAAIGGGDNSVASGQGTTPISGTTVSIRIDGGNISATAGYMANIAIGSGTGDGAGIGGGRNGYASITITGGHIEANSIAGAGIGTGNFGGNSAQGVVNIIGGTIRGYSLAGAAIGKGFEDSSYIPTYRIEPAADIMMYCRGAIGSNPPAPLSCSGSNGGAGFFVSVRFQVQVNGDIHVFNNDPYPSRIRYYPIAQTNTYMGLLFSTGHTYTENVRIFVDFFSGQTYVGMKQVVHYFHHITAGTNITSDTTYPRNNQIPSVKEMSSYPHQYPDGRVDALIVAMESGGNTQSYFKITEYFVDIDSNAVEDSSGSSSRVSHVLGGAAYIGQPENPIIYNGKTYTYQGFRLSTFSSNAGDYTNDTPRYSPVTSDLVVYLLYNARLERYLVYLNDPILGMTFIKDYHWLADAVAKCCPPNSYNGINVFTIVATEDDLDMTDGVDTAITIPNGINITLTSDANGTWSIKQIGTARHFIVYGDLTLKNIILQGMGYNTTNNIPSPSTNITNGGIDVNTNHLILQTGAVIRNCYNHGNGGAITVRGPITACNMEDGLIQNNVSAFGDGGAVYCDGLFNFEAGTISNNLAANGNGGGIAFVLGPMQGGTLLSTGSSNMLAPAIITNNRAPNGDGGGIYTSSANSIFFNIFESTVFTNNTASHAVNLLKTASRLLSEYRNIRTANHSSCPGFSAVHPLNNYDINARLLTTTVGLSKHVQGNFASSSKLFDFTITISWNSNATDPIAWTFDIYDKAPNVSGRIKIGTLTTGSNGTGQLSLKHNDAFYIDGIPQSCYVRIVEDNYSLQYYTTSNIDNTNSSSPIIRSGRDTGSMLITANTHLIDFINDRSGLIPIGIDTGNPATLLMMPLIALGTFVVWLVGRAVFSRYRRHKPLHMKGVA